MSDPVTEPEAPSCNGKGNMIVARLGSYLLGDGRLLDQNIDRFEFWRSESSSGWLMRHQDGFRGKPVWSIPPQLMIE